MRLLGQVAPVQPAAPTKAFPAAPVVLPVGRVLLSKENLATTGGRSIQAFAAAVVSGARQTILHLTIVATGEPHRCLAKGCGLHFPHQSCHLVQNSQATSTPV
jgi:hypothetical protein